MSTQLKPTLAQYQVQLKGKDCRWCRNQNRVTHKTEIVSLADCKLEHYDHPGGHPVQGYKEKQWMYAVCPGCGYQWSLVKLRLPDWATIQREGGNQ